MTEDTSQLDDECGDGQWHVFDYGEDFPLTERYSVIAPDGCVFFISHNGGVGCFAEEVMAYSTSDEMCDVLAYECPDGSTVVPSELELSPDGVSRNKTVTKGLELIKAKFDYNEKAA